ncbi:hypothetical protein CCR75_008588 [Bremia lactucae]|uniref:Transcriptional regulatory protein n=1 Tax=Bremia lactucae TaxID=4779 RepID=A0A976IFT4_BRELC|nr:hypothetical protein CCR75_008588 [Bremia lactucae]
MSANFTRQMSTLLLTRRRASRVAFASNGPLCAVAGVYSQSVRWMGRGPTIQGKKNATDAKRTTTNAKLSREIEVISKSVGGDARNVRLVAMIKKAKAANMPKDKIEAAIKRGVDGKDGSRAEAVLYEASGPVGIALMIETLTDNKHRTAPALRHLLGKHNGALGTNGSVAWMFEHKGYLEIEVPLNSKSVLDEDALMEIALKGGADDVVMREDLAQVTCDPNDLSAVCDSFVEAGYVPTISELIYTPKTLVSLDREQRESFDEFIDNLHENEDVHRIFHNVSEHVCEC